MEKYPVEVVDADKEHTLIAAKYKAHYRMSYADAFAASLAEMKKAVLVTGNKEFKQIEKLITVQFLK